MTKFVIVVVICLLSATIFSQQMPIPVGFEDVAILIEKWDATTGMLLPHGTGFIISDSGSGPSYLVTCRHLIRGKDSVAIRFNDTESTTVRLVVHLRDKLGNINWRALPDTNIDMIVLPIIIDANVNVSATILELSRLKPNSEIRLGDPVYFIGFPLVELVTGKRVYPVMRHGVVSQILKEPSYTGLPPQLDDAAGTILIDATSLGGNSGAPVISLPRASNPNKASVIGLVLGHKTTGDYAENANLGRVVPADRIIELLNQMR